MVNNDNNNNENNNNNNNNNIVEALIFSSTMYVDTFKINHSLNNGAMRTPEQQQSCCSGAVIVSLERILHLVLLPLLLFTLSR